MERKQWIVLVVVLLVLGGLYLAVAVYGLTRGDHAQSLQTIQSGVAGTLHRWLAGMAPGIDGARLQCNGQRLDAAFQLKNGAGKESCVVTIYPSAEKYRKATLRLNEAYPPVNIYVAAEKKEAADTGGIQQECIPYGEVQRSPGLEVYFPDSLSDTPASACWSRIEADASQTPSVDIVAMKEGGRLELVCSWCSVSAQRSLSLKLE